VSSETKVDLTHNSISFVDFMASERNAIDSYENKSIGEQKPIGIILNVKHNPIECDCHVYDLVRYYNDLLDETVKYMIQILSDGVICKGPKDFEGYQVESLPIKALTCEIFSKECPESCQCYVRPADKGLIIDCSNRGLTQIPGSLSNMNVTLLDGAQTTIDHIELDLRRNRIKQLPKIFEDSYKRVTKLYLSNNNITSINTTSLSPKLEVCIN
jgi:protein toll